MKKKTVRKEAKEKDELIIQGIRFTSRLWVGTGKYKDFEETKQAVEASGTDVVTVAVRRINIIDRKSENLLDYIDPKKCFRIHGVF
jgi:thiazole synthase